MQRLFYILFFFVFLNAFGQDPIFETNFEQGSFIDIAGNIVGTPNGDISLINTEKGLYVYGESSSDYIDYGDQSGILSFGTSDFAVLIWIKFKDAKNYGGVFGQGYLGKYNGFGFYYRDNGKLCFQARTLDSYIEVISDNALNDGNFHMVLAQRESGIFKLYVDNILQSRTVDRTINLSEISKSLQVYRSGNHSGVAYIGKAVIFDQALSSEERVKHNSEFLNSYPPIFETGFERGSFVDIAGNIVGTPNGDISLINTEKGLYVYGESSSDYIDYGDQSGILSFGTSDFAVLIWIKFKDAKNYGGVFGQGYLGKYNGFGFYYRDNGKLCFQARTLDSYIEVISDNALNDGNFHMVLAQRESGIFKLYVDNILQSRTVDRTINLSEISKSLQVYRSGNHSGVAYIGKAVIYNRALSEYKRTKLYSIIFSDSPSPNSRKHPGSGNWINLMSGTAELLKGIWCNDAKTCFVVGNSGIILKTNNGGNNWSIVPSGTSENLTSVSFINEGVGYITGSNSLILKTSDYGLNWTDISFDNSPYTINDAYFLTPDTGYVCGEFGMVAKTTDGGDNWDILPGAFGVGNAKASLFFKSVDTGLVVGAGFNDAIIKTSDGGITWTEVHDNTPTELYSVQFTGKYVGYVTSSFGFGISKTADGGEGWIPLPRENASGLYSIKFPGSDIGYAVGANGTVIQTTDAGNSWTSQNSNTLEHLFDVFFIDENIGYAVGANGTIIKTTSGNGGLLGQFRQSISFQVFPNPATDIINIEISNNNKDASYVLRNMLGKEIIMGDIYNNREWVNIGNLPGGIYILTITIDNISGSKKFIKN